jgi:peptidoglycan-associated lipoprotein
MRRDLALAACAVALAACPARPPQGECRSDGDCRGEAAAKLCVGGFCRQCRDDAQCPTGEVCRDNACAEKARCAQAKDCAAGQKCAAGACVPECAEASAERDCGPGRRCLAGRCAAEEECVADADCGTGKACIDGACKAQGSAGAQNVDCEVRAVHFGFDEATLSTAARETLSRDWQCLSRMGFRSLEVSGHADERGTTEYNLALGGRRAEAARKYLVGLGADAKALRAVSFGKERPVDPAHDESAWAKNRRVDLVPAP